MSSLDIILKDISDLYVRENFFRIQKYFAPIPFLQGNFTFFEIEIPKASSNFSVRHGLKFIPEDVFTLSVVGNHNFYFLYDKFDRESLYIHAEGPCVIRFLLGRLSDPIPRPINQNYPFVAPPVPADITGAVSGGGSIASESPLLAETFNTDVGTLPNDLVRVTGTNTVTKITDNFSTSIPNGIFGLAWKKPTTITVKVIFIGIMDGYSGFTPGSPLFVSTSGTPTHTVATTGMVQQIGFAISASKLFLQLGSPLRRT